MQVLEPVLIKTDTVTSAIGGVEQEVDFNFAALEGALILQTQFMLFADGVIADIETADQDMQLCLNYNPSFQPSSIPTAFLDDFTFSAYRLLMSSQSAVGLTIAPVTSPLYTHDSILIVRNVALSSFSQSGTPTGMSKIWYKRVIFDEQELVPFVALRR